MSNESESTVSNYCLAPGVAALPAAAADVVSASELVTSPHAAASLCHASPVNQRTHHVLLQHTSHAAVHR